MHYLEPILYGSVLALGLIVPLGPQNSFVLNQGALMPRFSRALPVIIVAALCDTFLILTAVLGVSIFLLKFTWLRLVFVIGGIFFITMTGLLSWRSSNAVSTEALDEIWPLRKQVLYALSVSLLNPYAYLDTIAVIGSSSLAYYGADKFIFTASCIFVSWIWFFGIAIAGKILSNSSLFTRYVGKVTAIIMWMSALFLFYRFILEP
jgi:L-lysine exporter family protein LysE/ArgO